MVASVFSFGKSLIENADDKVMLDYVESFSRSSQLLVRNVDTQVKLVSSGTVDFPITIDILNVKIAMCVRLILPWFPMRFRK